MPATTTYEAPRGSGTNRLLFLLAASVLINYIDRSNLSIAAPLIKDELGISAWQLGKLLSAFFWTYALMQIPAGWLVDRFDVKWVFAAGFFIWSASTAITGFLHGFTALLIIRVILGLGESVAFPSYGKILCGHFSESRRGFANAMLMAGLALGPALGMWVGGSAVGRFGWRPFFVTLGLGGFALAPAVVCVDAAQNGGSFSLPSARVGRTRHSAATVSVGHVYRTVLHQLLPLFSRDMVALLSGAGPPHVLERNGKCRRTAFPGFRNLIRCVRKTVGPLDSGRSLSDLWCARA